MPHFQIQITEKVVIDGKPRLHQETLFQAPVPAGYRRDHTGHRITCTLSLTEYQAYWKALVPRYQAGEECAWSVTIGTDFFLRCIGFLTEVFPRRMETDSMDVSIVLRDSGSRTIPTRTLPDLQPPT
jgi:hypothetical protein